MIVRGENGELVVKGVNRPKSAEAIYARAMELVAQGADSSDLAKGLSIPRAHAIKLHDDLFSRIWPGVQTKFDPETLVALKEEMIESNLKTVKWVDEKIDDGSVTAKEANCKNGAMKIVGQWAGFNAPTQIETTDRTLNALVNPVILARIMADPKAREALVLVEEFAAAQIEGRVLEHVAPAEGGDE